MNANDPLTSPYVTQANNSVGHVMRQVIYALLPGTLLMLWYFGWGVVSNLVLGIGFAVLLEALMLKLRAKPIALFLQDYSVVVTAWLLALALPAFAPWWLLLLAMVFAVVIAKHLYGGLGQNPFNPAMVGYAAMLVSFPLEMTRWVALTDFSFSTVGLTESLQAVFGTLTQERWDAITMATPLDAVKTALNSGGLLPDIYQQNIFSPLSGHGWDMINLAYLAGGLWLLYRRVISWHIPGALLLTLATCAGLFWLIDEQYYSAPLFHLLSGATMLTAFFIATDPVSASTTPLGKLLYAAGIGLFTYIIRTWGGYPDAFAFAVIIMNMAVPLLDQYTQPRVYGQPGRFGS